MELFYQSKLLERFDFTYKTNAILKVYVDSMTCIYSGYDINKSKVVSLINYLIKNIKGRFCVQYIGAECFEVDKFISPKGFTNKPYWFNEHARRNNFQRSIRCIFLPTRISKEDITSFDELTKKLLVPKGDILSIALMSEFSKNKWFDGKSNNIIEAILSGKLNTDAIRSYSNTEIVKGKSEALVVDEKANTKKKHISNIEEITLCSNLASKEIKNLISDFRDSYSKISKRELVLKAWSLDGEVIHQHDLPSGFLISKMNDLFIQNLEPLKHTYHLSLVDSVSNVEVMFHPNLAKIYSGQDTYPCNFSVPTCIYEWIEEYSDESKRNRTSLFIQAIKNSVIGWQDYLNDENIEEVKEKLYAFTSEFH
jgi:hypothetical protein